MDNNLTYKPFGNQAILIEWKSIISQEILADIILFKEKLQKEKSNFILDFVIGYNSLSLKYVTEIKDFKSEVKQLKTIYKKDYKIQKSESFTWEIPVCYDVKFGIDLEEISKKSKLSIPEIIKKHTSQLYTVYFIGFLPGFLYLGGLADELHFNRKPNPRLEVHRGSVAIGGKQTGLYPLNSPGGWQIIGKTPVELFNLKNTNPCFAKAGDCIKFKSISLREFHQLEKEILANTYKIPKTLNND